MLFEQALWWENGFRGCEDGVEFLLRLVSTDLQGRQWLFWVVPHENDVFAHVLLRLEVVSS